MNLTPLSSSPDIDRLSSERDSSLLHKFARHRSQVAFSELVRRHIGLVYSVALRRLNGDAHLAADVTQMVFIDLAQHAAQLVRHQVLSGWLFTATRFAAAKAVRGEQRRRAREGESHLMHSLTETQANSADWDRVRPVLDAALADLKESDRVAILLRFFENRPFAEIAARLDVSENAARMRVERALEKLSLLLTRRGASSSAGALGLVLAKQAVASAPAALTGSVTGAALAANAAAAGGVGATKLFMIMKSYSTGIAALLAIGGTVAFTVQARTNTELRHELSTARKANESIVSLQAENLQLAKTAVEVETLRQDDTELAKLRVETVELKSRLLTQENAAAARNARAPTAGVEVMDSSQVDRAPSLIQRKVPQYPPDLRRAGTGGSVVVGFIVSSEGVVQNAAVVSSTNGGFDAAAVAAVTEWKFNSGLKGGRAVNTYLQVPIAFTIGTSVAPLADPVPAARPKK